jgi:RHS repeat-associated protein
LGSSSVITDSSGKVTREYEYKPYGEIFTERIYDADSETPNFFYTGKRLDKETGLYYYGARYYDPALGKFITPDTIIPQPSNPQSLNRYSYTDNNPINYTDPTGHFKWKWSNFLKAAAGVCLGVVATMVLGPGGLALVGSTMAAMIGGAVGGALTGGLQGGWKGALIGAAMGGALGGLGSWGMGIAQAHQMAGQYMAGMLIAGAAVAAATDSLDSFAGGLAGGLAGLAIGNSINGAIKGPNLASETGSARIGSGNNKAANSLKTDGTPGPSRGQNVKVYKVNPETGQRTLDGVSTPDGYRYVGTEEAEYVMRTGNVPNTYKDGITPKGVLYTPEEGVTFASQAQQIYNLPSKPTYRIGLDTSNVTNVYGGNVEGGTGVEMMTRDEIPATSIVKLDK